MRCNAEVPVGEEHTFVKETSVAWSIPYVIPMGSEFLPAGKTASMLGEALPQACPHCAETASQDKLKSVGNRSKWGDLMQWCCVIMTELCTGEAALLADPAKVHDLESQLAMLAPDLVDVAHMLKTAVLPNMAGLAPAVAADFQVYSQQILPCLLSFHSVRSLALH